MNILMVSPMYPSDNDPVYGTFIKTCYDSLVSLDKDGKVIIVCIRGRSKGMHNKLFKYLLFYLEILYHLLFKAYDVVYVQTITTPIPPIKIISLFKSLSLVFNVHGADVITLKKTNERLRRMALPLLYKARMIVTPSEYFKNVVKGMLPGLPESKIFVSPSGGVDVKLFSPKTSINKVITFGFVSRIDLGKGWDTFINAMALLKDEGKIVHGIIAGRGAKKDEMMKLVKEKDLEDIIEYIGPVPHDELPALFRQFDAFVFPTRLNESLGLVGVEALACGIPVIGSKIAALPEYIIDGTNGFLFNCNDVHDLRNQLIKYIELDKLEKEKISKNARQSALVFETGNVMKNLYGKLNELLTYES